MSSAAFLGVFKRFVATRGYPTKMTSDNGTNFVGARRELGELQDLLRSEQLDKDVEVFCQNHGMTWEFAPPGSPHFGGLYEAAVKSAKQLLWRMMGTAHLNYDELNTLVKQVEGVLNSRPLTPIPSDETIEALTPGHFLIGRPLVAIPEPGYNDEKLTILQRYRLVQALHKVFWSRWSKEYLVELHHRYFWQNPTKNIPIGTVVVVKDDNLPPLFWKLAKVVNTHQGADGRVRVVTVKTPTGELTRTITKICPLPIDIEPSCVQGGGRMLTTETNKNHIWLI